MNEKVKWEDELPVLRSAIARGCDTSESRDPGGVVRRPRSLNQALLRTNLKCTRCNVLLDERILICVGWGARRSHPFRPLAPGIILDCDSSDEIAVSSPQTANCMLANIDDLRVSVTS